MHYKECALNELYHNGSHAGQVRKHRGWCFSVGCGAAHTAPPPGCPYDLCQAAAAGGLGVGLVVSEHGVEDVGAAAGEGDEGLVVLLLLSSFAVVIGPEKRGRWGNAC